MAGNIKKLALGVILTLAACASMAPIENVSNAPVPNGPRHLSDDQVRSVIAKAAIERGWTIAQAGPNKLRATHASRGIEETVHITYSSTSYSISYASSHGIEKANGMIDSSYNRHIDYLNMSISKALSSAVF